MLTCALEIDQIEQNPALSEYQKAVKKQKMREFVNTEEYHVVMDGRGVGKISLEEVVGFA